MVAFSLAFARQGGLVSTQLIDTNRGIRLKEILPNAQFIGSKEIVFRSCCGMWKECQPEDLFVAIVDAEQDGHDYTREAISRGASAIVTERLLTTDQPQCLVPDTREAYGKICQALAGAPSQRLNSIGVSGTDGKTTTCHLIRSVLDAANQRPGIVSSIEVDCGSNHQSVPSNELSPPRLAELLTQMVLCDCENAVVEIPSVALAKRSLSGVELDIAVITNIRQDHLQFHGSPQNYRRAKMRLLDQLKPTGVAILNMDDPTTHFLLENIKKPVLTVGIKQESDVRARLIEREKNQQTIMISAGSESALVRTSIIGDQHIYNCLSATAVGLLRGIDLATIAKGLEQVGSIPGRLERVECGQAYGVWIDSARSTSQLATAIRTLKQVTKGKLWCICSTEDGQSDLQRKRMGEIAERAADEVIITKSSVEMIADYEPTHQVLDGFSKPGKAQIIPSRFKAIEYALKHAKPGDGVLVTGCGEKPFALVGQHSWTITDRDVCQAWLYDNASIEPDFNQVKSVKAQVFNIDDYRENDC
jgi:UDP-N-acetylmuramoyl-L-alanyl-D-glutamate--2,6-diaminopimelate ligase